MIKRILALLLLVTAFMQGWGQDKKLVAGMQIRKSMRVQRMEYNLDAPADTSLSVILIQGHDIIIDFNQAVLKGSKGHTNPDEFAGIAVLVKDAKNVTIKNLHARGFKVALMARNVENLVIENCDFSYNYRQHLNSTPEREDLSDWMSYHHNEKDEWLRYGAAIYLKDCDKATVSNCTVTGGQNALMMMRCNYGKIHHNNFSFNSGIGIGMYRCSDNQVAWNILRFNIRGYSDGVYSRGQDSAGILVYEQSNRNYFFQNAVTHGGDGFFLWAGNETMESGTGGCNDNVLVGNDFSYAAANGIEATFSRNVFSNNRIFGCDYGIWGGYSFNTIISANKFRENNTAIAIEHGQENEIHNNLFIKDKKAIRLWGKKEAPSDWVYPKIKDTRSRLYIIADNSFNDIPVVMDISATDSLNIQGNSFANIITGYKLDSTVTRMDTTVQDWVNEKYSVDTTMLYPDLPSGPDPFKGINTLAGRKNIIVTEWGPYNFRYPLVWPVQPGDTGTTIRLKLLGPGGQWKLLRTTGVEAHAPMKNSFPAEIVLTRDKKSVQPLSFEFEYTGPAGADVFGKPIPANKPYRFYYNEASIPMNWEISSFPLDTVYWNPLREASLFKPGELQPNLAHKNKPYLSEAWWNGITFDKLYKQFITVAATHCSLAEGDYEFSYTWDDAIRIYLDDKLVVDEWDPARYDFNESPHRRQKIHLKGTETIRVEHIELGGFACLSVIIRVVGSGRP